MRKVDHALMLSVTPDTTRDCLRISINNSRDVGKKFVWPVRIVMAQSPAVKRSGDSAKSPFARPLYGRF